MLTSPIYSPLAEDPDLREIVAQFVAEIPDRQATLAASFEQGDAELLARTAHQLKGAVGSYGFEAAAPYAAALEAALRGEQSRHAVEARLRELHAALGLLRAGVGP
jgi:HPt (histidine-containing phosphotransfer) domain-containing protein